MKKSLLIAPALGVLVLAAAGSVGGTVAWFSSSSSWDMKTSSFAITKLDGNLTAAITPDHGTMIDPSDSKQIKLDTAKNVQLTHGSFDHSAKKVYSGTHDVDDKFTLRVDGLEPAQNADAAAIATYNNSWIAGHYQTTDPNDSDIYWAVSFKVTFTYTFPQNTTPCGLYFNLDKTTGSNATFNSAERGDNAKNTYKAFRLAIVGGAATGTGSATQTRVWAPFVDSSTYVNSTTSTASYGANVLMTSAMKTANTYKIEEGHTGLADCSEVYCLGKFGTATPNSDATLSYTFVAWFEGTDETNVVDAATLDAVTTALKFYTRQLTAA